MKTNISVRVIYGRYEVDKITGVRMLTETTIKILRTKNTDILQSSNITYKVTGLIIVFKADEENMTHKGSDWSFIRVMDVSVYINNTNPFTPKSYIDLPPYLKKESTY